MSAGTVNNYSTIDLTKSNIRLTDNKENKTWRGKTKSFLKQIKCLFRETTVEPCLFFYMLCTALSSFAVQNMHLEKSCRINLRFGDEICNRIKDRNTTGLELELNQVQSLVAQVVAWKFPLQTGIPAVMILFIGAWSDKTKKRKICILVPFVGEIIANIGLLFATYFELSLKVTALIEALPAAFSGSYIVIFMGMYSFMADRTTIENRTFRLGLVTICVTLGTPTGTALSGILLRALGYYGIFSVLILLYSITFMYGVIRLEDVLPLEENTSMQDEKSNIKRIVNDVLGLVTNTVLVAVKPRAFGMRKQILSVTALYVIMVGPLYGSRIIPGYTLRALATKESILWCEITYSVLTSKSSATANSDISSSPEMIFTYQNVTNMREFSDSQVSYLYAIRKFNFHEVEYSIYGTINIVLGLFGTFFCITFLCKKMHVQDSLIGLLAGVSRIAGCLVLALAPNRSWYYSAPVFNIFSHTGLTAVRSIATKSVPVEEVAKLNSVIGVMEAIAPSVYMPTSSFIYMKTIDTFPGAFYLFDAALTIVALILFSYIYILVKQRDRNMVTDPSRKEEFARTNEVSRF